MTDFVTGMVIGGLVVAGAGILLNAVLTKGNAPSASNSNAPTHSVVVEEMAEAFCVGEILEERLNRHGVSELTVRYLGKRLTVAWHRQSLGYDISRFIYDGQAYTGSSSDARYIRDAAIWRGENRLAEIERGILAHREQYLAKSSAETSTTAERTKVVSQASGQERVEPKQKLNPPSNGDEQP
jgi:hypothetical protein